MSIVSLGGIKANIVNLDSFKQKFLDALGLLIKQAIEDEISRMKLVDTGNMRKKVTWKREGDSIVFSNDADYAVYLEFGTYDYWKAYGKENFPKPGYPSIKKKKEMTSKEKAKAPKGMQPFAPYRRVLYNDKKITMLVKKAAKAAAASQ